MAKIILITIILGLSASLLLFDIHLVHLVFSQAPARGLTSVEIIVCIELSMCVSICRIEALAYKVSSLPMFSYNARHKKDPGLTRVLGYYHNRNQYY